MVAGSLLTVLLSLLNIHHHNDNPCDKAIIAIANRYSEHAVHLFPVEPNILSNDLIRSLNGTVLINNTSLSQQWKTDTFVVLSPNEQSVLNFLNKTPLPFREDTPWILGFYNPIITEDLTQVFEIFFNRGILNVITVHSQRSNAQVHTYNPFHIHSNGDGCYIYRPYFIDQWSSNKFLQRSDLFPKNKLDNVQKCAVKTFIFTVSPYILYSKKHSSYPLQGRFAALFHAVCAKMNFTPAFALVTNSSFAFNELNTTSTAIAFGVGPNANLGYRNEMAYRCFSWCAPTFVKDIRGWKTLTNTFTWGLWLFCIGSVILAIVVTAFLVEFSDNESQIRIYPSWLIVWNIVFEAPLPSTVLPRQAKLQLFFVSFCIAFLVISTAYKARLHVLMTAPPSATRFSTLSQVYDSELGMLVETEFAWSVQSISNEPFYKKRSVAYDRNEMNIFQFLSIMLNEGKSVALSGDALCKTLAMSLGKTKEGYYKAYLVPECILSSGGLGFGFSRKSPFSKSINRIIRALWEGGINRKIMDDVLDREVLYATQDAIGLEDVREVFFTFCWGIAVSFVVFIAEILCKHINKFCSKKHLHK